MRHPSTTYTLAIGSSLDEKTGRLCMCRFHSKMEGCVACHPDLSILRAYYVGWDLERTNSICGVEAGLRRSFRRLEENVDETR